MGLQPRLGSETIQLHKGQPCLQSGVQVSQDLCLQMPHKSGKVSQIRRTVPNGATME